MAPIRVGISHYLTPKLRPKDRWHSRKSIPPTAGPSEPGVQGGNLPPPLPDFGRNIQLRDPKNNFIFNFNFDNKMTNL